MPAAFGDVFSFAKFQRERMIPDVSPGIIQNMTERLIVRLAGDDLPVRFHAHIVERGSAAFDSQTEQNGIEMAVLGRGIPNQPLVVLAG